MVVPHGNRDVVHVHPAGMGSNKTKYGKALRGLDCPNIDAIAGWSARIVLQQLHAPLMRSCNQSGLHPNGILIIYLGLCLGLWNDVKEHHIVIAVQH